MSKTIRSALLAALAAFSIGVAPAHAEAPTGDTLYAVLGGDTGIQKIVADLLSLVWEDPRIKQVFIDSEVNRNELGEKLAQQFCALSAGPCKYTGKDMRTIHEDLGITNAQFNALAEDLYAAMDRNGVPYRVQNRLMALLAPMQKTIVEK